MVVIDSWSLAAATEGYLEQVGWEAASLLAMARTVVPTATLADGADLQTLGAVLDANCIPLRSRTELTSLIVHHGELRPRDHAVSERARSRHANRRATADADLLARAATGQPAAKKAKTGAHESGYHRPFPRTPGPELRGRPRVQRTS